MRTFLLLVLLFQCATAHICVFHPRQRGNLSVDTPGSPACFQREGQCGSAPAGAPVATYGPSEVVAVHFQQNLNHWYGPSPGSLDVSISYVVDNPQEGDFTVLQQFSDFPAHDMVWQTNFTLEVTLPAKECNHCVLRTRYISNNPLEIDPKNNTHAIFYQCSDISIVKSNERVRRSTNLIPPFSSLRSTPTKHSTTPSCCTPDFSTDAIEVTPGGVVKHRIWYSATLEQVRWDRMGAVEPSTGKLMRLSTITNYSSEVEYVFFEDTNVCEAYGPDKFYKWCFGENSMVHAGQETVAGVECEAWTVPHSGVFWTSMATTTGSCVPISTRHKENFMLFTNTKIGPVDPSVFVPPSQCKQAVRVH